MPKKRVTKDVLDAVKEIVSVVRHVVDNPDSVEVIVKPGAVRVVAELYTHPDDVGQVVGRNGYMIASLRALITALAGKNNIKIDLDYVTEQEKREHHGNRHQSAHFG